MNWLDEYQTAMMEEIVYHAVDLAQKVADSTSSRRRSTFVDLYQDLNVLEQTL